MLSRPRMKDCLLAFSVLSFSQVASAASGEGIEFILIFGFLLALPIPYSFLLASYVLYSRKKIQENARALSALSVVVLVLLPFTIMVLVFDSQRDSPAAFDIILTMDIIASLLIFVLSASLIKMGKIAVVILLLPLSFVFSFIFFIMLAIFIF